MKSLNVYLHNTTGLSLSDPIKKKLKEKILTKNNQRDVIVVPEAKCTNSVWIGATSGDSKYYFSGYDAHMIENGMRGILILIRKGKGIKVIQTIELSPDSLRLDLEIGTNKLTIVGVYGTSSHDDPDFFIQLRGHLADIENDEIAVVGDLNTTLCPIKDRQNYQSDRHWRSRAVIHEWLETGDYVDAYRALNPEGISMTWKQRGFPPTARLDYILLSNKLARRLKYCKTVHCPREISDHCGVEAELTLERTPPGPGTFRAMPNIEKDQIYTRSVKYLIREELINIATMSPEEKEAEHSKNNKLFEVRNNPDITKEESKIESDKVISTMTPVDEILQRGLTMGKAAALDYILMKLKNATKIYQRNVKALEKHTLDDLEKQIDDAMEDEDISEAEIEDLKGQHWKVLQEVCEREAAKLKTFQVLHDEKPSKGMIELEKKLTGYTNVSMLYGPVEEHISPSKGGSLDRAENPK